MLGPRVRASCPAPAQGRAQSALGQLPLPGHVSPPVRLPPPAGHCARPPARPPEVLDLGLDPEDGLACLAPAVLRLGSGWVEYLLNPPTLNAHRLGIMSLETRPRSGAPCCCRSLGAL